MNDTIVAVRPQPVVRNVQGLRALAALLVVLVHASLPNVGIEDVMARGTTAWLTSFRYVGLFGVDLFFAISGFIMLVTNWSSFGRPGSGLRFFARRAIRIYPAYWLALVPVTAAFVFARDRLMVAHVNVKTGLFESFLLLPQPNRFLLTIAWTLVWEIVFYVVFSQLLRLDRRRVPLALAAWLAVELVLTTTLGSVPNFYVHFLSVPLPIEFILGAFVGLAYVRGTLPAPRRAAALAVAATCVAWAFVTVRRIELDPEHLGRIAVFGIPAALIVYAAVALEARRGLRVPHGIAALGDASYAVYLWHLSILVVLRTAIARVAPAGPVAHAAVVACTLAIVFAAGLAVFHVFELPVTRRLNRLLDAALAGGVRTTRRPRIEAITHEA